MDEAEKRAHNEMLRQGAAELSGRRHANMGDQVAAMSQELREVKAERDSLQVRFDSMDNVCTEQRKRAERAEADVDRMTHGLDELVKLQAHYAKLLNEFDGGERIAFTSADEWLKRLEWCDNLKEDPV